MMKWTILILSLLLVGPAVQAQNQGVYSLDHVDGLWNTDTLNINQPIVFHIRLHNNTGIAVAGQTNGFRVYSETGVTWDTTLGAETGAITPAMFEQTFINEFSTDGVGADTIGFSGFLIFATGIPDGFNEITYTMTIGPIDAAYHNGTVCLDSSYFPPAGTWKWSTSGDDFFPDWDGPHCFTVFDPNAPQESNLIVTPDSLHFSAVIGSSGPSPQTFTVGSDGENLDFTISEDADWILTSPIVGVTTRTITVLINITGLSAGNYIDTILVESPDASNSPQQVVVTLELVEPAPTISVSPGVLFFNAIAGGSNPSDKLITITNTGGSVLNWSVTNSESWLGLNPSAGVDSGDVTISVDITGLPFGDYADTIVVSDPAATNDPQEVEVFLSVGSDLPVIAVDTQEIFVIVPSGVTSIPPRSFEIFNGGAGAMNFWLEESSPRIRTLSPDSGTAPQTVEVDFKVSGGAADTDYFDTVWVFSNEAINSPFPVLFLLHYVTDPAELVVTQDTVQLDVFECSMGADGFLPFMSFQVANIGGDDPVDIQLLYESDFFIMSSDTGTAPFLFTLSANYLNLPLGSYLDTIVIVAPKAINSPDTVFVKYSVNAGLQAPEIVLPKFRYTIPTQENSGPALPALLEVLNRFGGCMEWEIQEDIPWLSVSNIVPNVPGSAILEVNSGGMLFGDYLDTLWVTAPEATNSPRHVRLFLRVWRFHGDWDYNAQINISDLTAMVRYLFQGGNPPIPELYVGSMHCNHGITIEDLTYFVAYIFQQGPIPCGNPY